jgi:hypothetical protein
LPPHERSDFFAHRTESDGTLIEMAGFSLFLVKATSLTGVQSIDGEELQQQAA